MTLKGTVLHCECEACGLEYAERHGDPHGWFLLCPRCKAFNDPKELAALRTGAPQPGLHSRP